MFLRCTHSLFRYRTFAIMLGVLHLYPVRGNFQTQRSLELLLKNLGPRIPMTARSVGAGGHYQNLVEAAFRLRCARHDQSHIAHTWGPAELLAAAAAGFSDIIFSPQGPIPPQWWKWIELVLRNHTVEIVCQSRFMKNLFVSHGAEIDRCYVIPPAVDVSRLNDPDPELRARLGLATTDLVLLAPGESFRESAHRSAIWATAIMNVLDSRFRVLIWGRGPMLDSLDRFARAIEFNRTFVNTEKVLGTSIDSEQLVSVADMAIFFGQAGTPILPLAVCLSAGLPVVASASVETPEFLQDGINALVEPSVNPRNVAQRVLELQDDPPLLHKLAEAARASAIRQFALSHFVADWRTIYSRIVDFDSAATTDLPVSAQGC